MKIRLVLLAVLLLAARVAFSQDDYAGRSLTIPQCLEMAEKLRQAGDLKEATRYINTVAIRYWEEKNYPEAARYFNESVELNKQLNNVSGIAKLQSNLGMIYADAHDYEKSLDYFQLALHYRLQHGEKTEIISTYINKAVVLNSLKRYPDAAQNLEEALRLATEMSDANQMKSCYGMLAETYEKAGNEERTIHYFNLYRTFHEMVQRNKVNEANRETEAAKLQLLETELEKKEREIQLLATSRELAETEAELKNMNAEVRQLMEGKTRQDLAMSLLERKLEIDEMKIRQSEERNTQQRVWIGVVGAGVLMLTLLLVVLYRANEYKKNTNIQLHEQNEEIRALNENLESEVQSRTSQLRKTLVSLEKRNRDLDQFSHVISHNLRGPVANILGLGVVINRKEPADPYNFEVFDRLQTATKSLDSVVKDLTTILEVTDNQAIPRDKVRVADAIELAKNMLRDEVEKSNARIVVEGGVECVTTVKAYFESILYNLLSNAIKYAHPDRSPVVKITASTEGAFLRLSVADNGTGINATDLEKIFEAYKRLTVQGDGKGLGLYLVRTQVEAMGGTIEVSSQEGNGSTFTLRLPQQQ